MLCKGASAATRVVPKDGHESQAPAGPRHAHSSSSQSNRSVCPSASPRVTHGELRSRPSQPLSPPHPPSTGRGGHSSFKTDKVEETAGLNPKSKGKSRAPPSASSRFAGLRLPKGGKKNKPKHPNQPKNNPRNQPRMGPTDPTLRRAGYCFAHPRRGGHSWSRAAGAEPPACPRSSPHPWGDAGPGTTSPATAGY